MSESVVINFDQSDGTAPMQLARFMQLYITVYRVLLKIRQNGEDISSSYVIPCGGLFSSISLDEVKNSVSDQDLNDDPVIQSINQNSPMEIVICGSIAVLTLAIVFGGGIFELNTKNNKVKFNIKSLGHGILELKKALGYKSVFQPHYGFNDIVIKLNKSEYEYLSKYANMGGGFQRYLNELKARINKQTKELVLSGRDIDRIIRYKSKPEKGGFQSRFDKIFGRHFK